MTHKHTYMALLLTLFFHSVSHSQGEGSKGGYTLTLESALATAVANDPWLQGSQHNQDSIDALSTVAGILPDPRISIDFTNIPTDSFDFDQEAMSQLKVGVTQNFPRGNSRALQQKQLATQSKEFPYERQNRIASLSATVSELWLDAFRSRATSDLVESNRSLFEQLVDIATLRYSSAVGSSRQQDVIRAQLELTQIEDRLLMLQQRLDVESQQLREWLPHSLQQRTTPLTFPRTMPTLQLHNFQSLPSAENLQILSREQLLQHPAVLALEQKIKSADIGISLARQKYKPEWSVSASYGYRDNDPVSGRDRADLFSVGVSFDLPGISRDRQDQHVRSATSKAEAIRTRKWLLLRQLAAGMETARAKLLRLESRQILYAQQLLPQIREQADVSLSAYTNDDGDFSEVVRARIAQLNSEIDALSIDVERQKTIARLNYYLTQGGFDFGKSNTVSLAQSGGRSHEK